MNSEAETYMNKNYCFTPYLVYVDKTSANKTINVIFLFYLFILFKTGESHRFVAIFVGLWKSSVLLKVQKPSLNCKNIDLGGESSYVA